MKVIDIERIIVDVPFTERQQRITQRTVYNWSILELCRVTADTGDVGWGETVIWLSAGAAADAVPATLSEADRTDLARIETYLNGLTTMESRFLQFSEGGVAEGRIMLDRPGRLRIEYAPPVPVLMIANNFLLMYHDTQLKQTTFLPVSETPAALLIDENIALSGDVTVTATPNPKTGEIDILVDVRDLWSLVPRARLVRSSGETTLDDVLNGDVGFQVSLEDSNLSGTGQDWSFRVRREQPDVAHEEGDETPFRTRTAIRMFEPNVFQSRWQMLALYEQQARPDVDAWELSLLHPLYSLRSRWSFRFTALERGGVSEFQRDGVLLREWERRVKRQFASTTFVSGEAERQVQYTLWVSHEADAYDLTYSGPDLTIVDDPAFFSTRNTERRFSVSPSAAPLQTAALAGASVTWQRLRFTEARNIDRLGRVEDIPLGGALTLSVGGGARALANDHDELRPTASYRYSQMLGTHGLFEMKTTARVPYVIRNGRDGTRGMQDVVLTGSARMFIRGGDSRALVWRAHAASLGRTTRDLNLLLDKRNGVRGYPSRSFDGRRRVGLNAEARQVVWTNSYLVTQAAAFGDIGYVWWDPFDVADPKRAVGVGLRLGLQRLAAPAVRADMAYLLDTDPPEWKWSFGTGQYF